MMKYKAPLLFSVCYLPVFPDQRLYMCIYMDSHCSSTCESNAICGHPVHFQKTPFCRVIFARPLCFFQPVLPVTWGAWSLTFSGYTWTIASSITHYKDGKDNKNTQASASLRFRITRTFPLISGKTANQNSTLQSVEGGVQTVQS